MEKEEVKLIKGWQYRRKGDPKHRPNIGKEIVKEIEKEENDLEMGEDQQKEKAGEKE